VDDAAVVAGDRLDGVLQVQPGGDAPLDAVVVAADVVGDEGGEQGVLAAEQRIHRAGRQAGLFGDLAEPGPVAVAGDDPARGVEQGAAVALLRLGPCRSHNRIITVIGLWISPSACAGCPTSRGSPRWTTSTPRWMPWPPPTPSSCACVG